MYSYGREPVSKATRSVLVAPSVGGRPTLSSVRRRSPVEVNALSQPGQRRNGLQVSWMQLTSSRSSSGQAGDWVRSTSMSTSISRSCLRPARSVPFGGRGRGPDGYRQRETDSNVAGSSDRKSLSRRLQIRSSTRRPGRRRNIDPGIIQTIAE